ncbi:19313_t:CDS:10, partial [Gigaspora rosea]
PLIDKYFKQSSPEIETWVFCLITINKEQFLPLFEEHVNKIGLNKVGLKFFKDIITANANTKIALREIVNRNHTTGVSTTKSPKLFAQFCDSLIKDYWVESEFERDLENFACSMTLFNYVDDKDILLKFYAKLLVKRLVNGTSQSEDAENRLISKLKEICVDFTCLVLNTACPILPSTSFTIPNELEETFKNVETFYQSKYTGRKLNWLFHLSKGRLKANYCKSIKCGYYFVVRNLRVYNSVISYDCVLTNTLKILITTKVLKLINVVEVGDTLSCYELNMDFKRDGKSKQNEQITNTRFTMLWYAVYNTMKIRKNMKFNDLVNEVIAKAGHRLKPKTSEIKNIINELLEKEYIKQILWTERKRVLCSKKLKTELLFNKLLPTAAGYSITVS